MNRLTAISTLIGASLLAGAASVAHAQVAADRAVKYRQSALTVMAASFGGLNAFAKGERQRDANALMLNATIVDSMAKVAFNGFLKDTPQSPGTKAKPEIWKEYDKFQAAAKALQDATPKLVEAAKSGNKDTIAAAAGGVGKACKECHDAYQSKEVLK